VPSFQIAQLNVGRSVAPMDDARMAGFVARLDEINALADGSPGFVWRLQGDNGNATELKYTDDPLFIVNLSVWESLDDLHAFTYRSNHKTVFARRFEWFERSSGPNVVIWWQPAKTIPSVEDALRRLALLERRGPTPEAFTFRQPFEAPGAGLEVAPAPS
jgi:heme-degrading monooxygenase HmoA